MNYTLDLPNKKVTIDDITYGLYFEVPEYSPYDLDIYVAKITPKYITLFGRKIKTGQNESYPTVLENGHLCRLSQSKFSDKEVIEKEIHSWLKLRAGMYATRQKINTNIAEFKSSRT